MTRAPLEREARRGYVVVGTWTLFAGLVVIFPLLGQATWHAFRALVEVDGI